MNLLQELYLVKSIIEEEEELIKILFICHGNRRQFIVKPL